MKKWGVKQHWLTPHSRKWGVSWPPWPRASAVYAFRVYWLTVRDHLSICWWSTDRIPSLFSVAKKYNSIPRYHISQAYRRTTDAYLQSLVSTVWTTKQTHQLCVFPWRQNVTQWLQCTAVTMVCHTESQIQCLQSFSLARPASQVSR